MSCLPCCSSPATGIDVWAPLNLDRERNDHGEHSLLVVGRLATGASAAQAMAEMRGLSSSHEAETNGHVPAVMPRREWLTGTRTKSVLWGLVRELMVRTALGASRQRLLARLVTERMLLAAAAGGAGLLLAVWSVDALVVLLPESASFAAGPALLDSRVLCYTLGISLVAGLVFGGLPALRYSRIEFTSTGVAARARSSSRIQRGLLVAQAALAVTLLAGAGLLTRSFLATWQIDPGFSADGVMTARVSLQSNRPGDEHALFFTRVIERLGAPTSRPPPQ